MAASEARSTACSPCTAALSLPALFRYNIFRSRLLISVKTYKCVMRAYVGDELDAELEHALVRAVLEHDVVRRGFHLEEISLAALRDDLADMHPADHDK